MSSAVDPREEYDPAERYFLAMVLERCADSRGLALEALHAERVPAIALPDIAHLRLAYDHVRPRVLIIDVGRPGEEELALLRTLRANDVLGAMSVVLVGDAAEQELPAAICEQVNLYVQKPANWKKVAKAVIELANARRPPSSGMRLLTA